MTPQVSDKDKKEDSISLEWTKFLQTREQWQARGQVNGRRSLIGYQSANQRPLLFTTQVTWQDEHEQRGEDALRGLGLMNEGAVGFYLLPRNRVPTRMPLLDIGKSHFTKEEYKYNLCQIFFSSRNCECFHGTANGFVNSCKDWWADFTKIVTLEKKWYSRIFIF